MKTWDRILETVGLSLRIVLVVFGLYMSIVRYLEGDAPDPLLVLVFAMAGMILLDQVRTLKAIKSLLPAKADSKLPR